MEHPAFRAARMVRDMHVKTIQMIDSGSKFMHRNEDGTTSDVTQEVREKCFEQIACCEQIMDRAEHMSEEHTVQAHKALIELTELIEPGVMHEVDEPELPEMGGYEHRNGG